MCMNNVNASIFLTTGIKSLDKGIRAVGAIFNGIIPQNDDSGYYLPDFTIMVNTSFLFEVDHKSGEILDNGNDFKINKEYEIMIRLTHVDSGFGATLDKFDLIVTKDKIKTWCKGFYEFRRFIKVPHLELPRGLGNYAVKLLIREKDDSDETPWTTQVISSLIVGDKG